MMAARLICLLCVVNVEGRLAARAPEGRLAARAPERRLMTLRGGNAVINIVKGQAEQAIREQERRDDLRSLICLSRATVGLFFVFQPLKHMGFVKQPVGRAVMQLFFVSHFYLRLCWLVVNGRDFFGIPRSWRGKLRKRAVSSAILAGCIVASRHVGWAREDLPIIRRALPSGLALGVVVARTATSLFDYASSEIRERLHIVAAKRAIFQPEHADVFIDIHEKLNEHLQSEEERALNEAAKEARAAVERAIKRKSALQERARKKRANKRALQVSSDLMRATLSAM